MFKNKKWLVFLIVIFPSLFWVILETSTINSRKLSIYGPRKLAGADTVYYKVNTAFEKINESEQIQLLDLEKFPLMALMFVKDDYKNEAYRVSGLWEYVNYKTDKIKHMPFVFVSEQQNNTSETTTQLMKMAGKTDNLFFYGWNKNSFDSLNKVFFNGKPIYVDYSFFILIDNNRNVRGYYDARYVAEIKRLIEDYQHLRIKEEKNLMLKENEIKSQ